MWIDGTKTKSIGHPDSGPKRADRNRTTLHGVLIAAQASYMRGDVIYARGVI
jgi:hypothetical protein